MSEIELFAANHDAPWFTVYMDSCLLFKPTKSPYVVIADKEVDVNALVSERSERLQERTVLLFAAVAPEVFAPKIEYVSEQVDGCSILRHVLKHGDKGLLVGLRIINSPWAKMCVGEEVNHSFSV